MANTIRYVTLDEVWLCEVSLDPSVAGQGVAAPTGSFAILNGARGAWQKIGPLDTDWAKLNPDRKSGWVLAGSFAGTPKTAAITFSTPFPTNNYVVFINGGADVRSWTYESATASGFVINSNANKPIVGSVSWSAELIEETS